jgi:type VI secretion system secreted protein Hcp
MAAVDYFLKIDGIDGESTDAKHKNEIDVESWSWGASNGSSMGYGGGGGTGKVSMEAFHFVMKVNKATPKLILHCCDGKHIKSALLTVREAGGKQQEYLKFKFTDLMIVSYSTGGSGGSDIKPMDTISFNYSKIEVEYAEQKADGSLGSPVTAGWNLKENVKV